jgi:ABC-2 type transport system permease protein
MNLRRMRAVAWKEWRETVRDRMFLALAFLLPVLWMVIFGYGLVLDVEHIPIAALDFDRSEMSRDFLSRYQQSRYFNFVGYASGYAEIETWLLQNRIRAAVIVPEKFQEELAKGRPVNVQTIIDGVFPLRADTIKGYVIAINGAFSQETAARWIASMRGLPLDQAQALFQPLRVEVRYLYNQEIRSVWTMATGLIMFALMLASPLLTALGVVREKERGSIYNIYSSTVTRLEFLVGKLAPYVLISSLNAVVLSGLAVGLFGVPFKGHALFFLVASVVFVTCSTGIGLIISLMVMTQQAALIITMVLVMLTTFMYSGLMFPVSSMSPAAQIQAHLFPGMYYTEIVRGSFLKGLGPAVLGVNVVILAGYALFLWAVGYLLFRKRPTT